MSVNQAYSERNMLVAFLSTLYESHLYYDTDIVETQEWPIVCIHGPTGQMSWHIPVNELEYFSHLSFTCNDWDEHTTQEKYDRLEKLKESVLNANNSK